MDDLRGPSLDSAMTLTQQAANGSCLPVLQAGGFGASVDAFAWEPAADTGPAQMRLWFVSLLGSQQAVKALWAHLIKGETAALSTDSGRAHFCVLASEGPRGWRFFRASLPTVSAYHGVLVPEMALYATDRTEFLLLSRAIDDVAMLHYRFLNRRVPLPLHPTWVGRLWERALRTGEARPLESQGLEAYRCAPGEANLAADLAEAIRQGKLGLPDEDVDTPAHVGPISSRPPEIGHGPT